MLLFGIQVIGNNLPNEKYCKIFYHKALSIYNLIIGVHKRNLADKNYIYKEVFRKGLEFINLGLLIFEDDWRYYWKIKVLVFILFDFPLQTQRINTNRVGVI